MKDAPTVAATIDSPSGDVVVLFTRALDFAAKAHVDQRRKGARAEPYVNHLAEVAALTAQACGGTDATAVLAALLHDTLEDTDTTYEALAAAFGVAVADVVAEVTDDRNLTKAERKHSQIVHAPHASPSAKLVKLADKTSNLRSLAASPPAGWSKERILEYIQWAEQVAAGLRGTNEELERLFDAAAAQARAAQSRAALNAD